MNTQTPASDAANARLQSAHPNDVRSVALEFLQRLTGGTAATASALLSTHAQVDIVPAGLKQHAGDGGVAFFESLVAAFPDLLFEVKSTMCRGDTAVIEVKMQGTQAADFLGIHNQEKHIDLDQAWVFRAGAGRIDEVRAYWCQNQLYRRLAVKRLDAISITG